MYGPEITQGALNQVGTEEGLAGHHHVNVNLGASQYGGKAAAAKGLLLTAWKHSHPDHALATFIAQGFCLLK